MRTILINHLLEPPGRVTGITRFLFALIAALLTTTEDSYVLLTCWAEGDLPPALFHPRLRILSERYRKSTAINALMQNFVVARAMRDTGAALEFNGNPLGAWMGSWPRVIVVHDLYMETMPEAYARRHRITWKTLFPLVAQNASRIVVPSSSTRDDLLRSHPAHAAKVEIIPEAPAFAEDVGVGRAPMNGRYGLLVGNMSPNKNPAPIVGALARLADHGHRIPMLHVGRDELGLLSAISARHPQIAPITSIAGVDDGTLKAAYANAAFFINSSLHEGFCLPIVEAQSFGAPVIASNRSAVPEVAGDGALLVDPTSVDQIADAIARVWTDAAFAEELGRSGRRNADQYSWERTARMTSRLFDQVTSAFASVRREVELPPFVAANMKESPHA